MSDREGYAYFGDEHVPDCSCDWDYDGTEHTGGTCKRLRAILNAEVDT